eukprot:3472016-Prymnesium_polylepis.1
MSVGASEVWVGLRSVAGRSARADPRKNRGRRCARAEGRSVGHTRVGIGLGRRRRVGRSRMLNMLLFEQPSHPNGPKREPQIPRH